MTLPTIIYLASVSNALGILFGIFSLLFGLGMIMSLVSLAFLYEDKDEEYEDKDEDEEEKSLFKIFKILLIACFISAGVCCALPDKKTVYMMISADAATQLYSSETDKKVMELINQKLDEQLGSKEKK